MRLDSDTKNHYWELALQAYHHRRWDKEYCYCHCQSCLLWLLTNSLDLVPPRMIDGEGQMQNYTSQEENALGDNYDVGVAVDAAVDVDIDVVAAAGDAAVGDVAAGDAASACQSLHDNDLGQGGEHAPSHSA